MRTGDKADSAGPHFQSGDTSWLEGFQFAAHSNCSIRRLVGISVPLLTSCHLYSGLLKRFATERETRVTGTQIGAHMSAPSGSPFFGRSLQ